MGREWLPIFGEPHKHSGLGLDPPSRKSGPCRPCYFAMLSIVEGLARGGGGGGLNPKPSTLVGTNNQTLQIAATGRAFAAIRGDGSVVTWGHQAREQAKGCEFRFGI